MDKTELKVWGIIDFSTAMLETAASYPSYDAASHFLYKV